MKHAFIRKAIYDDMILDTLSQGKAVCEAPSLCSNARSGVQFTIAEELIRHAYAYRRVSLLLFVNVCLALKKQGIVINADMIQKITCQEQDPVGAAQWMYQQLIKLEFKQGLFANHETLLAALSHNIDLNADCELNNALSIKEQLLAYAYQLKEVSLVEKIVQLDAMPINTQKIAQSMDHATDAPNMIHWINQVYYAVQLFALQQGQAERQNNPDNSPQCK